MSPDDGARSAGRSSTHSGRLRAHLRAREVRSARALEEDERWTDAAAAYRTALSRQDDPVLHARLARVLEHAGRGEEAVCAYREALARDSTRAAWHFRLGRVLQRLERRDEAVHAYRQALAADDTAAEWHFQLGAVLQGARRWDEAAQAYRDALARSSGTALWHARLGDVLARRERWSEAAAAYRDAVAHDADRPTWHARLGHALVQERAWQEAADALRTALQEDDGHTRWWEDLGRAHEGLGQHDEARSAYTRALDHDPATTDVDRQLLAARARHLPARRQVAAFLAEHLDEVRELAAAGRDAVEPGPPRVWVYWAQGWDSAPAVVRRCHEELLAAHAPGEVVALDDGLAPYWVTVPLHVSRRTARHRAAYSDALRLELLVRYGGIWVDATCLVRGPLPQRMPELMPAGFFAFRFSGAHISNWLLASEPGGYVVTMLRAALTTYWRHHRTLVHYFVFHHLFEALYLLDEGFRSRWDATPERSSGPPHRLQSAQLEPYDPQRLAELLDGSFVHKLTHKVRPRDVSPDSLLAAVVRDLPD